MSGGLWSPQRRAFTGGLVMTVTLVASESLAVGTVMPLVARDLGDRELYGWVFAAFFLATLVGIVVAGGLVDRGSGLTPPLAFGLGCFAAGLAVGGLAPSMPVLVAGRVLQGLGAGFEPPIVYLAIARVLPEHLRPRMFAYLSTAWVLPGVAGPAVAGLVADLLGWRWIFLGLLPLIGLAAAVTLPVTAAIDRAAPPGPGEADRRPAAGGLRRRAPLAVLIALGAGLLLAGLGWLPAAPLEGAAVLFLGLAIALPAYRSLTPPGTLAARPVLPAAVLLRGLLTFSFFVADAYVPLALVEVRGTAAATAGIALTAATLAWSGGAWIQARLAQRVDARGLVGAGFLVVIGGLATTSAVLLPSIPLWVGIAGWGVAGLGMGLAYAPLSLVVLREAAAGEEGLATAGLQLSDVVGTAVGTGVGGSLVALVAGVAGDAAVDPGQMAAGVGAAFLAGMLVGLFGAALTGRLRPRGSAGTPLALR